MHVGVILPPSNDIKKRTRGERISITCTEGKPNVDGVDFQNTSLSVAPLRGPCLGFHVCDGRARHSSSTGAPLRVCLNSLKSRASRGFTCKKASGYFTGISRRLKAAFDHLSKEKKRPSSFETNIPSINSSIALSRFDFQTRVQPTDGLPLPAVDTRRREFHEV